MHLTDLFFPYEANKSDTFELFLLFPIEKISKLKISL